MKWGDSLTGQLMPRDPNCVFCKIVAGDLPARTVRQNDVGLAFLDINPLADGHLLWVPKEHYPTLHELPPDLLGRLCASLPRLGLAVMKVAGAAGYNILQNNGAAAGQLVNHAHFHLIPRVEGDGLGYRWPARQYPPGRAEELANQLQVVLAAL